MVNFLFKKSYQLNSLKPVPYDDLWGKKGVFTTIRVLGRKPKLILIKDHLKRINLSLKIIKIDFKLSYSMIVSLLNPILIKNSYHNGLLRIAISRNKISISLRSRLQYSKSFSGIIYSYQRSNPDLKNLYYKKINKLLNSIDQKKEEVILSRKGLILEGCTTNLVFVSKNIIYIPIRNYYRGITMKYLLNKTSKKIRKTNISINNLHKYEEILLLGSGKGVVRLLSIPKIKWKSKSQLVYKEFQNLYKKVL